ncbi:hypothetical protein BCR35DRAFT_307622 [Leucosporidium creatinivorum]|uniref:Uncharacterized protein n=1 Tax=Leucosporidium creatinivorum TaxID=106004 RepID=A0A1Y2EMY2_9BASI|nr:hypothetical protein BCR35DRAFT_307622 [Leucosporidium creatinivorum]
MCTQKTFSLSYLRSPLSPRSTFTTSASSLATSKSPILRSASADSMPTMLWRRRCWRSFFAPRKTRSQSSFATGSSRDRPSTSLPSSPFGASTLTSLTTIRITLASSWTPFKGVQTFVSSIPPIETRTTTSSSSAMQSSRSTSFAPSIAFLPPFAASLCIGHCPSAPPTSWSSSPTGDAFPTSSFSSSNPKSERMTRRGWLEPRRKCWLSRR